MAVLGGTGVSVTMHLPKNEVTDVKLVVRCLPFLVLIQRMHKVEYLAQMEGEG